jgi:Helix-turn-helix domain
LSRPVGTRMIPTAFPTPIVGGTVEPSNRAAGWTAAHTPSEALEGAASLTISEAARACGVNRRTIRRHREAGDFPGMFKDEQGAWRILISDLEAAGYPPLLIGRLDEPTEATQLDRLRGEVAVLRARLQATERVARERQARIEDLRLVLRMLPGPGAAPDPAGRLGPSKTEALPEATSAGQAALAPSAGLVVLGRGHGRVEASGILTGDDDRAIIRLPDVETRGTVRETLPAIPAVPLAPVMIPPVPERGRRARRGWWLWRRDAG